MNPPQEFPSATRQLRPELVKLLRTLRPEHSFTHALESEMLARASARRRVKLTAAAWPRGTCHRRTVPSAAAEAASRPSIETETAATVPR